MKLPMATFAALLLACAASTAAPPPMQPLSQTDAALPEWDRLTSAQRDVLIAPMRDRWNQNQQGRQHMYKHAQRWQSMTPEQRSEARRGMQRFGRMDPQQRERSRVVFDRMQAMTPDQRTAFRNQWKAMTSDQRHDWIQRNAPAEDKSNP